MPTYQYACTDCGDRSEVVQRFTDDPLSVCSACGGKLRKVFSPVGIVFKGSGFYRTDSRNGSSAVAAKDGAAKDGAANGSGSTADGSSATSEAGKSAGSSSSSDASSSSSSAGSSGSGEKKSSVAASAAS